MSLFNRVTTWVAGQLLKSADLNGEFNNLVNGLNNLDGATTSWTNVKAGTFTTTGGGNITNSAGYVIGSMPQLLQTTSSGNVSLTGSDQTILTQAITPKATTHKVLIRAIVNVGVNNAVNAHTSLVLSIKRGGSGLAVYQNCAYLGGSAIGADQVDMQVPLEYLDAPSSTSSLSYTVTAALYHAGGGSAVVNDTTDAGVPISSLTVIEIAF